MNISAQVLVDREVVKEVGREGENICHTEELESHLVNTTYLESVKVGSKILIV